MHHILDGRMFADFLHGPGFLLAAANAERRKPRSSERDTIQRSPDQACILRASSGARFWARLPSVCSSMIAGPEFDKLDLFLKRDLELDVAKLRPHRPQHPRKSRKLRGADLRFAAPASLAAQRGASALTVCGAGPGLWRGSAFLSALGGGLPFNLADDLGGRRKLRRIAHADHEHLGGSEWPRRARRFVKPFQQHLPGDGQPRNRKFARKACPRGRWSSDEKSGG